MNFIKSLVFTVIFILVHKLLLAQKQIIKSNDKPKLVIGLVIDQMRYDYLIRFQKNMGKGGFNRLLNEGYNFTNCNINYIPTVTGCGHASIYTGSVPALNGIASNDWYDKANKKMMYCAQDDSVQSVGAVTKAGKMSPKNLWATTIGDQLKLHQNFKGQVLGIALKDRGAILTAGHAANAAYWMDDSLGYFITSTYYTKELPTWVTNFNLKELSKKYLQQDWQTILPIAKYTNSTIDDNLYEGKFKWEQNTSMPHTLNKFSKAADIKRTPFGNSITLDFAKEAIKQMQLGKDEDADLLAISLSSTDYVGHQFGINAIELEDTYYRLDKELETFLNYLDSEVGKNNYTLFLSSDHGCAHNPVFLKDNKLPGENFFSSSYKKIINEEAKAAFGCNLIVDWGDNQIWINDSAKVEDAKPYLIKQLSKISAVHYVIPTTEVANATLPQYLRELLMNSYTPARSGDLFVLLKPGYLDAYGTATTGTTHGAWNPYDTHIPFILYGNGIKKGKNQNACFITDIAATICALLEIQVPNTCIGNPKTEAFK